MSGGKRSETILPAAELQSYCANQPVWSAHCWICGLLSKGVRLIWVGPMKETPEDRDITDSVRPICVACWNAHLSSLREKSVGSGPGSKY